MSEHFISTDSIPDLPILSSACSSKRRSGTVVVVKRITLVADRKTPAPSPASSVESFNSSLAHHCSIDHVRHYHHYSNSIKSNSSSASSSRASSVKSDHHGHHSRRTEHLIYRTSDVPRARRELPAPSAHSQHTYRRRCQYSSSIASDAEHSSPSSSTESIKSLSSASKSTRLIRRIRRIFKC
ncbi:hypothetical protein BGW41_002552 [Actinomortierella wolfii]|nr:hypothetical protein BGW41_002552 [Actinomortierella wolfii]